MENSPKFNGSDAGTGHEPIVRPCSEGVPAATPPMPEQAVASATPPMTEMEREVADAMAALAAEEAAEHGPVTNTEDRLTAGADIIGTVVGSTGEDVFLQFGVKSQGVMPRSQFGAKEVVDVGRRVDVTVDRFDADSDLWIVSRKGSIQRATWTNLKVGMIVEGRVTGVIKGGLEIDLKGIRAFMPGSQADIVALKDISLLLNETVRCEVIELDRRGKNVLVSRRKILERQQAEDREKLKNEMEVGQLRKGVVRRVADFGAFVDIGGLDGLLHIRDLSWGTVDKVTDVLNVGDDVEVRILKIDDKRGRISLGLKQALPDPWDGVPEKYSEGTTLKVRIVRLADFGAFAELEAGVEALIPISEMSWSRIRNTHDLLSVGDLVDCVVIRVEPEKHRLALSMKQAKPDPWSEVLESFSADSLVKGKVTRLADFGAFVELAPGVEGLVHISELADRHVKTCSEVVQAGAEVETRVLGVDKDNRRISLSIKAVNAPAVAVQSSGQSESPKPKKRKKPLRGGLASHFEW